MNSLSLGKKLFSCVIALFAFLVILSAFINIFANGMESSFDRTANSTMKKIILAHRIDTAKSDMLASQRGLFQRMVMKEYDLAEKMREAFREGTGRAQKSLDEMQPLLVTVEEKQLAAQLQNSIKEWPPKVAAIDALLTSGNIEGARLASTQANISGGMGRDLAQLEKLSLAVLEKDKQNIFHQASSGRWLGWGLTLLSLLVGIAFVLLVKHTVRDLNRLSRRLSEGSSQVAHAATQVSASSQALAQGASEQAATLEETSSSAQQVTSMTSQNTEKTRVAAGLVDDSGRQFEGANQKLGEMVTAMEEISGASNQVAKIIKVIDEIAFQTNILALNAAVEAARAGEAGMGFAVVADEVRNLAQRSAQAAKDTQQLIETAVSKSAHGAQKVQEVAEAIALVSKQAQEIKALVDEVSAGSAEQAKGLDQIAGSMSQMEQVTQKAAAGAEESAAAGQELNAHAASLLSLVRELKMVVDGNSAG